MVSRSWPWDHSCAWNHRLQARKLKSSPGLWTKWPRTGEKEAKTQKKPSSHRCSSCWETAPKLIEAKERQTKPTCGRQSKTVGVVRWHSGDRPRVRGRVSKGESGDQKVVAGGHRRVSTGQAANVAVLLPLFALFHRNLGFSYKTLEGAVRPESLKESEATKKNWFAWDKSHAGPFQAGVWRSPWDHPLQ